MTSCSVVIAAFDEGRMPLLARAVASAVTQAPDVEVVVAIDNDHRLHRIACRRFSHVRVVLNEGPRGASATRNAGARAATGEILAFLDDDAEATPGWLRRLVAPLHADPSVVGVGGWVEPNWADGRPVWFPMELGWVVGASYTGLPQLPGEVRNGWSENMAVRAADFWLAGGFREGFGKVDDASRPEDTELCLRMAELRPGGRWWIEPAAVVRHYVPLDRTTLRFLWRRCRAEGAGKAELARIAGPGRGLATERHYLLKVLPQGVLSGFLDPLRGRIGGPLRAAVIVLGLVAAALGFAGSLLRTGRRQRTRTDHASGRRPQGTPGVPSFTRPARVLTVDLATALRDLPDPQPGEPDDAVVLVALCGRPLGMLSVPASATAGVLATRIKTEIGALLRAEASTHGLTVGTVTADGLPHGRCPVAARRESLALEGPGITVVVCTRNRPTQLRRCLDSLDRLDYRDVHVLVVDNAPVDSATEKVCRDRPVGSRPVDYVREAAPGLSRARNRALREINRELVAFVDDDEVVDRHWLSALVEEFTADPEVAAVTGLVLPADLSAMPQVRFERWGGHSKGRGFVRTAVDPSYQRSVQPAVYPRPTFGAGANMAFRLDALTAIGGFDPCLGAGTPTRGGEDTLALTEVMLAGHTLVYTPQAITWHFHRTDEASLADQLTGYSRGLGAYYTALLARDPARIRPLTAALLQVARRSLRDRARRGSGPGDTPPEVPRVRRAAALAAGPVMYAWARCTIQRGRPG
ncbi:glycosyltransferase [Nocardioides antri]|uniref:Glycosyltransferase n=1 Tax=Nocardioides antri TaxID=2607659 RepID=A0A5B1LYS7_9ACTN|nr:glycosyltransferase [Nocardioides antri]KAA1425832.1 glycosyltransferase [Nocardioides antri]